jgi:hypothetical protein
MFLLLLIGDNSSSLIAQQLSDFIVTMLPLFVVFPIIVMIVKLFLGHSDSVSASDDSSEEDEEDEEEDFKEFKNVREVVDDVIRCQYCGLYIERTEFKDGRCPNCSAPRWRTTKE